jgi:uncharacterized protein (TIGR02271 family)
MAYQDENRGDQAQLNEYERLIGYDIEDTNGNKVGKVETVWEDRTGQPAYLGVRTGWLGLGKIHVIPAHYATYSERRQRIRLPFEEDVIKNAPEFDAESEFTESGEERLYEYFQGRGMETPFYEGARTADWTAGNAPRTDMGAVEAEDRIEESERAARESGTSREEGRSALREGIEKAKDFVKGRPEDRDRDLGPDQERTIPLSEERLNVGKRQVESGGARLRKVVRTETVNQPVELQHEEIEVERVPAQGRSGDADFREEEIFIPLRKEVPDVSKEAGLREEVRVSKRKESDREQISEKLRKEDVEIDKESGSTERTP